MRQIYAETLVLVLLTKQKNALGRAHGVKIGVVLRPPVRREDDFHEQLISILAFSPLGVPLLTDADPSRPIHENAYRHLNYCSNIVSRENKS